MIAEQTRENQMLWEGNGSPASTLRRRARRDKGEPAWLEFHMKELFQGELFLENSFLARTPLRSSPIVRSYHAMA